MTLNEVVTNIRKVKPNSFKDSELVGFVNEVEAIVYEYLGTESRTIYVWPDNMDDDLMVPAPYSTMYEAYLKARIDQVNEEYELYENSQSQFNSDLEAYKAYAMRSGLVNMSVPTKITNWW